MVVMCFACFTHPRKLPKLISKIRRRSINEVTTREQQSAASHLAPSVRRAKYRPMQLFNLVFIIYLNTRHKCDGVERHWSDT